MNDISEVLKQFLFVEINNETKRIWFANTNIYTSSYIFAKELEDQKWRLSIETKKNENCVFTSEILGTFSIKKGCFKEKSIQSQNKFSFRKKEIIDHFKIIGFQNPTKNEKLLFLLEYFIDDFINITHEKQTINFHLIKNKEESDNKIDSKLISNLIKLIELFNN
jgi:hypothetical protein